MGYQKSLVILSQLMNKDNIISKQMLNRITNGNICIQHLPSLCAGIDTNVWFFFINIYTRLFAYACQHLARTIKMYAAVVCIGRAHQPPTKAFGQIRAAQKARTTAFVWTIHSNYCLFSKFNYIIVCVKIQ